MSGGQWTDPVDVGVEGVPTTLLTNIADNLRSLHKGNGHTTLAGVAANASKQVDINANDESFEITDSTNNIGLILSTGRQPGNKIYFMARNGTQQFDAMETASGNYKAIKIYGGASIHSLPEDGVVMFMLGNDGYWHLGILQA